MLRIVYGYWFINTHICEMDIKEKIGRRIKEIREQKNMSQKDLSFSSNLDRSYITSVENGQRNISIINLEKIANALEVTLSELFKINNES